MKNKTNQIFTRAIALLVMMLSLGVGMTWAEDASVTFTVASATEYTANPTGTCISVANNDMKYSSPYIQFTTANTESNYSTITVSSTSTNIKQIVVNFSRKDNAADVSGTGGTMTSNSDTQYTWKPTSGTAAVSSVVFSCSQGGKCRVTSLVVTYTSASTTNKTIYLNTGGSSLWNQGGAKFAIYYYKDDSNYKWSSLMTQNACNSDIYSVTTTIPSDYTKCILVRLSDTATVGNWTAKWNQTANQDIPETNDYFTVTSLNGDNCTGSWGVYTAPTYTISFDDNTTDEVSGTVDNITGKACGASVTLPTSGYTRSNYTFLGWNTDASATTAVDNSITVSGNQTYYAVWQAVDKWFIKGYFGDDDNWTTEHDIVNGSTSITLPTASTSTYQFKILHQVGNTTTWWGLDGSTSNITSDNCTNWGLTKSGDDGKNCGITSTVKGSYKFAVTTSGSYPVVTVTYPVAVTGITLNKTTASVEQGGSVSLSVSAVAPSDAADKTYTWSSSNTDVATVTSAGVVTVASGATVGATVDIYATANDGSGVKGTCTITVTEADAACFTYTADLTKTNTYSANDLVTGANSTPTGGTLKVVGGTIKNSSNGLSLESSSESKLTLTLDNALLQGAKLTFVLYSSSNEKARGITVTANGKTETLTATTTGDFNKTIDVTSGHKFIGQKEFTIARSNNACIKSITITGCEESQTPTQLSVPSNLASSNVTSTGAKLTWGAVDNASSYTVKIGETEYTGVTTNSYTASGLTASTGYDWYVKAVGDGTNYSTSSYSSKATFTTAAALQPSTCSNTGHIYMYNDASRIVSGVRKNALGNAIVETEGSETALTGNLPNINVSGVSSVALSSCYSEYKASYPYLASYIKAKTSGSKITITLASGYEGTLTLYFGAYSSSNNTTVTNAANSATATSDKKSATTENDYTSKTLALKAGANELTFSSSNAYISHMDIAASPIYIITYKPGTNGTGDEVTDTKSKDVALILKGVTYTRSGYTQTGWTKTDGNTTNDYAFGASYTENAAMTLYPVWTENVCTEPTINTSGEGYNMATATYAVGATPTALKVVASKGDNETQTYQWYKNTEATATVDDDHKIADATNDTYTPDVTAVGTTYYYCVVSNTRSNYTTKSVTSAVSGAIVVEAPKYDVKFYTDNGETQFGTTQSVESGSKPTEPGTTAPTKSGYTFVGWSKTYGGTAVTVSDQAITAAQNFYACWSENPAASNSTTWGFSEYKAIVAADISDYNGLKIILNKGTVAKDYVSKNGATFGGNSSSSIRYIEFTPSTSGTFKVTFKSNNSSDAANRSAYIGTTAGSTTEGGYLATATASIGTVSANLTAGTKYYVYVVGGITISKLEYNFYNVTLHPNGGTGDVTGWNYDSESKVYTATGISFILPTSGISKTGYTFSGWKSSEDLSGDDVSATGTLTANAEYWANWVDATPTVGISGNAWMIVTGGTTLTATVTGSHDGATYQWYKDGTEDANMLSGKAGSTLTISNATVSDRGSYYCKVTNGSASAFSPAYTVKMYSVQIYEKVGDIESGAERMINTVTGDYAGSVACSLAGSHTYYFKMYDGYYLYGHEKSNGTCYTITSANAQSGVTGEAGTDGQGKDNFAITTTKSGTYVFNIEGLNGTAPYLKVTYPSSEQEVGKTIYFDNSGRQWSGDAIYYRIGKTTHNSTQQMSLVTGTANLYQVTTITYSGFEAWHIANNAAWSGENNSIYKTNTSTYKITEATNFSGDPVTADMTIVPNSTTSAGSGDNEGCTFYGYDTSAGMLTHTATIGSHANGTIKFSYTDVEGTNHTDVTTTTAGLAHTCNLTITATANTGYELKTLKLGDTEITSGSINPLTADATISATFSALSYGITYKDQGDADFSGTHAASYPTTHTYGTMTTLDTPTKTGFDFGGWFTNKECTGTAVTTLGATDYIAAITLYAKWVTPAITINYANKSDNTSAGYTVSPEPEQYKYSGYVGNETYYAGVSGTTYTITVPSGKKITKVVMNLVATKNNSDQTTKVTFNGGTAESQKIVNRQNTTPTSITKSDLHITGSFSFSVETKHAFELKVTAEDYVVAYYTVTCATAENGSVEASPTSNVEEGTKVTVTPTANTGFELNELYYEDASGVKTTITKSGSTYSFAMPNSNVTVYATFKLTLTGISVVTPPTKTTYLHTKSAHSYFDPAGLVIRETYGDNSTVDITYNDETKSGFTFNPSLTTDLTSSNSNVSITYAGKSTTQDITVNEDVYLTQVKLSNGFNTAIVEYPATGKHTISGYYLSSDQTAATIDESTIQVSSNATYAVDATNKTITVTSKTASTVTKTYTYTITAVDPLTDMTEQTITSDTPAWLKLGKWSSSDDSHELFKSVNGTAVGETQRIIVGVNRVYLFVGPCATLTLNCTNSNYSNKSGTYSINGGAATSIELTKASAVTIPVNSSSNSMIELVNTSTSGSWGFSSVQLAKKETTVEWKDVPTTVYNGGKYTFTVTTDYDGNLSTSDIAVTNATNLSTAINDKTYTVSFEPTTTAPAITLTLAGTATMTGGMFSPSGSISVGDCSSVKPETNLSWADGTANGGTVYKSLLSEKFTIPAVSNNSKGTVTYSLEYNTSTFKTDPPASINPSTGEVTVVKNTSNATDIKVTATIAASGTCYEAKSITYYLDVDCESAELVLTAKSSSLLLNHGVANTTITKTGDNVADVTYSIWSDATCKTAATGASIQDGIFTATAVGTYYIMATQSKDGTYCATATDEPISITVSLPKYTATVVDNETGCSVTYENVEVGKTVTVTHSCTVDGKDFLGFISNPKVEISHTEGTNTYTFVMPESDVTLTADWANEGCMNKVMMWKKATLYDGKATTDYSYEYTPASNHSAYFTLSFQNADGTADADAAKEKQNSSLTTGKVAGNGFTFTPAIVDETTGTRGTFSDVRFTAKIQDETCQYSTDGSTWNTLKSTNTSGDAQYEITMSEASQFSIRNAGTAGATVGGVWIRNMELQVCGEDDVVDECPVPTILSQTTDQTSVPMSTNDLVLTVKADGDDYSYQWYATNSDGAPMYAITDSTRSSYTIKKANQGLGIYFYMCKVTSGCKTDRYSYCDPIAVEFVPADFTVKYTLGVASTVTTLTSSQTSTSGFITPSAVGTEGLDISSISENKGKNGILSPKIPMTTSWETDQYVKFDFTIADGKKMTINDINVNVQPVSCNDMSFKAVLFQNGTQVLASDIQQYPMGGQSAHINWTFSSTQVFTGSMELRVYAVDRGSTVTVDGEKYTHETASGTTPTYRIGKTVTISGVVTSEKVDPKMSWADGTEDKGSVTKTYGDARFALKANSLGDGAITYSSSNTDVATIESEVEDNTTYYYVLVHPTGSTEQSTTITASQPETDNYKAASISYTLTVKPIQITMTKVGWGTYYTDREFTLNENLEGYTITEKVANILSVKLAKTYPAGSVVPAKTPILVHTTESLTTTKVYDCAVTNENDGTNVGEQLLYGMLEKGTTPEIDGATYYYKLYNGSKGLGWYWGIEGGGIYTLGANKAYLALTQEQYNAAATRLTIVEMLKPDDSPGVATDVSEQSESEVVEKFVQDGRFYIRRGNKVFDLNGKLVK